MAQATQAFEPSSICEGRLAHCLLEAKGTSLRFPHVSHIDGRIYELRGQGSQAVRIYYWQQDRDIFVAAAGEVKQKKKADRKLIERALAAYAEYNKE